MTKPTIADQANKPPIYNSQKNSYEPNPFKLVINGFNNVFNYNSSVTIILIVISIIILILNSSFNGFRASVIDPGLRSGLSGSLLILALVLLVASIVIRGMSWLVGIQSAKHKAHKIDDYFKHTMLHFWQLIGYSILYSLLIFFGFILFIVPGIVFSFWYSLTPMIILDQNKPVFEAMDMSKKMVKGMFWEWAGVYVTSFIFSVGGILSVPSSGGGKGLFYQQLKNLQESDLAKPKTHWLNYVLALGSVIMTILVLVALSLIIASSSF